MKATKLAQLYRRRWRIENLFQRLESVLHSEVRTLGHPRAALLAFGVALLAYNGEFWQRVGYRYDLLRGGSQTRCSFGCSR